MRTLILGKDMKEKKLMDQSFSLDAKTLSKILANEILKCKEKDKLSLFPALEIGLPFQMQSVYNISPTLTE